MSSETTAVLVAVRVRPFNSRESPLECTLSVPNCNTVVLTDVGGISSGSSSANSASAGGQQHVFSFDKIFWSVPPHILPISRGTITPPSRSPICTAAPTPISRTTSIAGFSSATSTVAGMSESVASPLATLPCFARAPEYDNQEGVYSFIGPRMHSAVMSGYNTCLFAYGQTGSGKTHSMMGPPDGFNLHTPERGIMPRLCEDLFEMMHKEREEDESVTYNVECSFLEIYCERVRDLLAHSGGGSNVNVSTLSVGGGGGGGRDSISGASGPPTPALNTSGNLSTSHNHNTSMNGHTLRVRQHPTRGPYVEGLSLVKVRDASGVMRQLIGGLRERVTAETRMNEHSSRSHAILQLHITRVAVVREEAAVVTKTRTCKVNMVDLAGSERVSQSGATGDRFEEARNINLSLSTLGRVIQQLSEKQTGRHVVPAYRDSVLTWLLSDSLGGNSKTIMLATIAPSAYCYQQTLNTLRFAGVTKKVINVATVNEDKHFQKLINALRQQIVKLTLQLEEGKASEVHHQQIESLRRERDEFDSRLHAMRAQLREMVPATEVAALRRRVAELTENNTQLQKERTDLQRQFVSTTTALREELASKRGEIMRLRDAYTQKEGEALEWRRRYNTEVTQSYHASPQSMAALPMSHRHSLASVTSTSLPGGPPLVIAESRAARAEKALQSQLESLRTELSDTTRQLEEALHELASRSSALDAAQAELAATRAMRRKENEKSGGREAAVRAELTAQLDRTRADYLAEKQTNVDLLMRVSRAEKEAAERGHDVTELEQLLLEETETSERYYLRLRHAREVLHWHSRLLAKTNACRGQTPTTLVFSPPPAYLSERGELDTEETLRTHLDAPHAAAAAAALLLREEAVSRAGIERVWLQTVLDLLHQRVLLHQAELSESRGDLLALRADCVSLRLGTASQKDLAETGGLRRRVELAEAELDRAHADLHSLRVTSAETEAAGSCLQRRLDAALDAAAQLQSTNDLLVARLADGGTALPPFTTPSDSDGGESGDGRALLDHTLVTPALHGRAEAQRLTAQLASCREELGVLHAQLEAERAAQREAERHAQNERHEWTNAVAAAEAERHAALTESTEIVRACEQRVGEWQSVVAALRSALAEERHAADRARDVAARAENRQRDADDALRSATEAAEAERREHDTRLAELRAMLRELQGAYEAMERRLADGAATGGDVYLTLERGAGEDNGWMEKARREREGLERQKRDAQRLNAELLAMVRRRNESLREVNRQITKIERGGLSPEQEENEEDDRSPLHAQFKKE